MKSKLSFVYVFTLPIVPLRHHDHGIALCIGAVVSQHIVHLALVVL